MRNYLCWDPGEVRQVINPFAEHISDSLFRAVHTDWDLKVSPPVGKSFQEIGQTSWTDMTPPAFLADFLREDRPHALAAILGETGSGKSHLVHWMRLNIQPTEKRVVLVVRKSGTSLRNIVKMIIDELPTDQQASFLETLQSAGDGTQSRNDQKQQLLNDLAQAIREEALPTDADEIEQELVKSLPNLFQDPHMRQEHFLRDNTVIADIVDHIFAPSNAKDRPDQRRLFVESDLPLGGMDFAQASRLAQDTIKIIELEPNTYLPLAVKIINRNLDRAVARTLSFSGDRVEELMNRLRTHLKSNGQELVLLIEEFARLQGIDRALLQAITSQGDESQCKMRTAIAVTTGFFQSVAETAYMRTTHVVDMNRSAGRTDDQLVTEASLSQFIARYLNAVRLGPDGIKEWSDTAAPGESPTSKCATCPHQTECHAIFGESDGYGLYPFTHKALWNAASRADRSLPERLNPRVLQNDLLVEVLDNFGPEISTGTFPPYGLLKKLGSITAMPAVTQAELRNRNPQNYHRWAAFLELYDGTGKITNLDDRLRSAFDVPEIPGAGEPEPSEPTTPVPTPDEPSPNTRSKEDLYIEKWIAGDVLDQSTANTLRNLVYAAITNAIDWDMIGLSKTSFVGKTGKPFQTASISFDRQTTQVRGSQQVKLKIPGNLVSPETAAAALQGLLRADKNEFRWEFPDGDKMLGAFLDCVDIWAKAVEAQLHDICQPTSHWNQAVAAVELLCVGAAIGGKIKPKAKIADMIDGAFSAAWANECASQALEMKLLYKRLLGKREKLVEIARSQMSSMKGGRAGAMLNPVRIVGPIRAFRRGNWRLMLQAPEDNDGELAKLYRETRDALTIAAEAEMAARTSWLSAMVEAFGEDASRASILTALERAGEAMASAGIGTSGSGHRLTEALERFSVVQFDDSLAAARALLSEDDPLAALPQFGRGRRNAVDAGKTLVDATQAFLDTVEQNMEAASQGLNAQQNAVSDSLDQIDTALSEIESDLTAMSMVERRSDDVT